MPSPPKWKFHGFWLEMDGTDEAARVLDYIPRAVAAEVYNTFGYMGEVLRARLAEAFPAAGGEMDSRTKRKGQATGKGRASVVFRVRGNKGDASRPGKVSLVVYPRARYLYMLGYGWAERTIRVSERRVRSRDVRARIASGGAIRRRIVSKGYSDTYLRRHHLEPHPVAPPIIGGYREWIRQQVINAINRGTQEATNGAGS